MTSQNVSLMGQKLMAAGAGLMRYDNRLTSEQSETSSSLWLQASKARQVSSQCI